MLRLVVVLACACGSTAKAPLGSTVADDTIVVERFEIRGVSDARRAELLAFAKGKLAAGKPAEEADVTAVQRAIENFYLDNGYVHVKLEWSDWAKLKGSVPIVLTIREGAVFRIVTLDVADVSDPDRTRYLALAPMKPGEVFARAKLRAWIDAVDAAVGPAGAFSEPETTIDHERRTVAVRLHIKQAP